MASLSLLLMIIMICSIVTYGSPGERIYTSGSRAALRDSSPAKSETTREVVR